MWINAPHHTVLLCHKYYCLKAEYLNKTRGHSTLSKLNSSSSKQCSSWGCFTSTVVHDIDKQLNRSKQECVAVDLLKDNLMPMKCECVKLFYAICIKNGKKKNTVPTTDQYSAQWLQYESFSSGPIYMEPQCLDCGSKHEHLEKSYINNFCPWLDPVPCLNVWGMAWLVCLWFSNMMMNHHLSVLPGAPDLHQPEWLWMDDWTLWQSEELPQNSGSWSMEVRVFFYFHFFFYGRGLKPGFMQLRETTTLTKHLVFHRTQRRRYHYDFSLSWVMSWLVTTGSKHKIIFFFSVWAHGNVLVENFVCF